MMADEVYRELERQIILGVLRPRERLVEVELCRKLGVSRTLLREVFRRLEGVGLVALTPNRGAVVRDFSPEEIEDLYFVRSVLEGAVASLIVERVRPQDLRDLRDFNRQFDAACQRQDMAGMIWTNIAFHRRMSQVSGNPFLCQLLEISRLQTNQIRYIAWTRRERVKESLQDHREMLTALAHKDAAKFQATLFRHVAGGKRDYQEIYSHQYGQTPAGDSSGPTESRRASRLGTAKRRGPSPRPAVSVARAGD